MRTISLVLVLAAIGCDRNSESSGSYERKYPDHIQGIIVFDPFAFWPDRDRLGAIGVNTLVVYTGHKFENGSFVESHPGYYQERIQQAHQAGFAVLLALEFWEPNVPPTGGVTMEAHLQLALEKAVEVAVVAEGLGVEFIAPYNEFNGNVLNAYPEVAAQIGEITSDWHHEASWRLREVFGGKLVAKLDPVDESYDLSGYEYIGVTVIHEAANLEQFRQQVQQAYQDVAAVAAKSGAQWIVSEAIIEYGPPQNETTENEDGDSLDDLQDEYFQVTIEEYHLNGSGSGYIVAGWIWQGAGIKDRPAEQVVAEFFLGF